MTRAGSTCAVYDTARDNFLAIRVLTGTKVNCIWEPIAPTQVMSPGPPRGAEMPEHASDSALALAGAHWDHSNRWLGSFPVWGHE